MNINLKDLFVKKRRQYATYANTLILMEYYENFWLIFASYISMFTRNEENNETLFVVHVRGVTRAVATFLELLYNSKVNLHEFCYNWKFWKYYLYVRLLL